MKTIIAGSRDRSLSSVDKELLATLGITEVVCGGARGIDTDGRLWAEEQGIPVKMFPADWNKYGKSAGCIRNEEMAVYADMLVAFWDGESRGTKHMIRVAGEAGLKVIVNGN